MTDRFKLEELIISVRQITEDLQVVMQSHFDTEKGLTEDQIMNAIIGMQQLHECRCDALFNCMEKMIEQGDIKENTQGHLPKVWGDDGTIL